ncbi:bifunctional pyr operon transcriptional regulator/uracil phosphoribosyltransferase PyrR [Actomonas aquatica]|uniref:Bifunctional pyr operon transcriptional regulator/uracil phosphoribosyltransferase PyrR n=1 Tax=Actomonas aquatica TaxID=2866162 RepID=A0ABZ1CC68_9BACT|nr:bifunctional pyr operon transcriptional regulator/uracil phosphoribosyltransferase PyrR [Opitutus sp. WL0086]WRQ89166.1 bifunctional pyr operon transcriptional regulator/uracil phosphoribosyltransferase PyrR [Opitutus sp. WL0086]
MPAPLTFDAPEIHSAIERITTAIRERHGEKPPLALIGIANGGSELARRLHAALGITERLGEIDISFYRDDIGRNPIPKESRPTIIPFDVHGKDILLVDDVLHSGRTLNAALNELFDHGRPASVELAILVDRGGRKLPFAANYTGITVETTGAQKVTVDLAPEDPTQDRITIAPAKA